MLFGAIDAALPHSARPVVRSSGLGSQGIPDSAVATAHHTGGVGTEQAAQQMAEQFVTACDTTDPAHPEGDVATEPHWPQRWPCRTSEWPAAWVTEDRSTTVVLDPPGQSVAASPARWR